MKIIENNLNRLVLFLKSIDGVGNSTIRKFIVNNCFEDFPIETSDVLFWLNSHSDLFLNRNKMKSLSVSDIEKAKLKCESIEKKFSETGCGYISFFDSRYPKRFKKTSYNENSFLFPEMNEKKPEYSDYPPILFYKGDIDVLNAKHTCAVVGTRNPCANAISFSTQLAGCLAEEGCVVISGLAEGCDTYAHRGCLEKNGKTAAFLGTGIDVIYPKENSSLAESIICNGGLLVSEYFPGFVGNPYSFVERDRLQAMSSDCVFVIQTSKTGGSMHAAKAAGKYNRSLYVVDPSVLDGGDTDGNVLLINDYNGKKISNFRTAVD